MDKSVSVSAAGDASREAAGLAGWSPRAWRRLLGWAIVGGGATVLLVQANGWVIGSDPKVQLALLGGSIAALATALGTIPVLLSQQLSQKVHDTLLGFGAGVMLAAAAFRW